MPYTPDVRDINYLYVSSIRSALIIVNGLRLQELRVSTCWLFVRKTAA